MVGLMICAVFMVVTVVMIVSHLELHTDYEEEVSQRILTDEV
jgi:hypothetical protein